MRVVLTRHLLFGRQDRLDRAEVDVDHPRVGALLDHARDNVAFAALELAEHLVVADVAQTLRDDLLGGEGGDASEVGGVVDRLADDLAVLIEFGDVHRDVAGLAVEFDARAHLGALVGVLEIRDQDGLLDDPDQFFKRNLSLALHEPQHSEVDVHLGLRYSDCARPTLGRIDAV